LISWSKNVLWRRRRLSSRNDHNKCFFPGEKRSTRKA
jgi:hypothetical protein